MHIYFSGAGGKFINALAHIALDVGYSVSGSDLEDSPALQQLIERGAQIHIGQTTPDIERIHAAQPIDWLVHTAALPKRHPELEYAHSHDIKTTKREPFLHHILELKNLKLLAVSGTHGKTTTTAMIIWLFKHYNIPVSYVVGADLRFGPSGQVAEQSEWFVLEADEFDRTMLKFQPDITTITNINYDHPDIYPTQDDYTQAFRDFVHQSKLAVLWEDDATTLSDVPESALVLPMDRNLSLITLPGSHNRSNAWLAVTAYLFAVDFAKKDDLEHFQTLLQAVSTYPGAKRRLETIQPQLLSDFAHTPEEIAATLQAAREIADHITVVYQPHQNIRQHQIKDEYETCFNEANQVIWLPTFLSREDPNLEVLTPADLIPASDSTKFTASQLGPELVSLIQQRLDAGQTVIAMGAGDIDTWLRANFS